MKPFAALLFGATLFCLPLFAEKGAEEIRLLAVDPTPEPETVVAAIQIPQDGKVIDGNPIWMQVRIDGFALGTNSPFDRADELANTDMGQTLHVVIDNNPYFAINGPSIQPFNEEGFYYNQSYKFEIPYKLQNGFHTVRVFAARSFGESLKGSRAFQTGYFYVGKEGDAEQANVLSKPGLIYNEPSDQIPLVEKKPVLLDFYLSNCDLTPDGYKVRVTIDGKTQRTIVAWRPYYIYGLKKGKHTLQLDLIDGKNKVIPGSFTSSHRTITVR